MKKTVVFLIIGLGLITSLFGQDKASALKLKLWDKFQIDIPANRSLDVILQDRALDFRATETSLTDGNYNVNPEITGRQTVLIYQTKDYASFKEVQDFIKGQNGKSLDPQALLLIWEKKHDKIKKGQWLMCLTDPQCSPNDLGRPQVYIWNLQTALNDKTERYIFDSSNELLGFPKNSLIVVII